MTDLLSTNQIVALAESDSGGFGYADAGLTERVDALVTWVNDRGPYSPERLRAMQQQIVRLLATRLRLASDRARYPQIADEPIERPVFIIGFGRSGTTLLHSLLAEDPQVLSPKSWHMFAPSPPPGARPVARERYAMAQRAVERWMDFCPGQKPLHPYIDKGAYQLVEDEEVFCLDFRNAYIYHLYEITTLEPGKPAINDPVGDFRFHRTVLQHLQWNSGLARWVCKGPAAQANLDALCEVYPDALCVWPHRPIAEIYPSLHALSSIIYNTINGRTVDWRPHARQHALGMKAAVDRMLSGALVDDPRVMHVPFRQLTADPLGVVRAIYERRGTELTTQTQTNIQAWLADPENGADRYGSYPYSCETLGLDRAWVEELFAEYGARFGLSDR